MLDTLFGGNAAWFTIPALIGTGFFLLRLLFNVMGLGDGGLDGIEGVDVDVNSIGDLVDADVDDISPQDLTDSDYAFKLLSLQAVAAFCMGFGWGGLAGLKGFGWGIPESIGLGVVFAAASVWLLMWLMKLVYGLQVSGNVSIGSAVGHEGTVYIEVPGAREGTGRVRMQLDGRLRTLNAITEGDAIPSRIRVKVVGTNDDNSVTVVRA
ncbi:MAG: hypothetical protein AAFX05_12610 [Planctomycetota bacterium]